MQEQAFQRESPKSRTFAHAPWIHGLGFVWGLAEATIFFVVPDVLLTFVAANAPKRVLWHVAAITIGAVCGGMFMYGLGSRDPARAVRVVDRVPFIPHRMIDQADRNLLEHGAWGAAAGPTAGVPYKVYAVLAPKYSSPMNFALTSIPVRAYRFVILAAIAGILGWVARRWLRAPDRVIIVTHAALWIAFYAWFWIRVSSPH